MIANCAIIPASAWNFHPQGAFCSEARGAEIETHAAALRRLNLLALALDPSLPYEIVLTEASAPLKAPGADTRRQSKAAARAPRNRS